MADDPPGPVVVPHPQQSSEAPLRPHSTPVDPFPPLCLHWSPTVRFSDSGVPEACLRPTSPFCPHVHRGPKGLHSPVKDFVPSTPTSPHPLGTSVTADTDWSLRPARRCTPPTTTGDCPEEGSGPNAPTKKTRVPETSESREMDPTTRNPKDEFKVEKPLRRGLSRLAVFTQKTVRGWGRTH